MQALLNRLSHVSPIPVMVRATLENVLLPEVVNRIFAEHAVSQSQRVLLFSDVVELMMLAVELKVIAKHLDIGKYRKHKRGPKKPPTPRTRFRNKPHVATKRLLDEAKAKSSS